MFLHALIRIQRPKTIVELGVGVGASTWWMADALRRNGGGHLWAIDNFLLFEQRPSTVERLIHRLNEAFGLKMTSTDGNEYLHTLSQLFNLESFITFGRSNIQLRQINHFADYPFSKQPIDMLFSDFKHGPSDVVLLCGHFLPQMSETSSIFIHSASSCWSSYLVLERICEQLNSGSVPQMLQKVSSTDLTKVMKGSRLTLIHLTDPEKHTQNSCAWIKREPIDLIPHPLTTMK